MPGSIDEAEKCIVQSKLKRQKTLDSLHIDELTAEGKTINQLMNSSFSKLQDNPEFTSTLVTVQKLVDQITNIKSRLDLLWNSYHLKLETNLRKHKFKKDTEQVRVICVAIILHTCAPFPFPPSSFPPPPFLSPSLSPSLLSPSLSPSLLSPSLSPSLLSPSLSPSLLSPSLSPPSSPLPFPPPSSPLPFPPPSSPLPFPPPSSPLPFPPPSSPLPFPLPPLPLPFPLLPLPFPFPLPPLPFPFFPLLPLPFPFPLPPLPFPFPFLPILLLLFLFQLSLSPIFHDLPSRTDRGVVRGVCR